MIAFVPYAAICGITYAAARSLASRRLPAVAAAAVTATLPLLYYHAAITYLDVAAAAIGCYITLLFLRNDHTDRGLVLRVASAASMLVPIKETAAPLAAAAAMVLVIRVLTGLNEAWYRRVAVSIGAVMLIAVPGALYFVFVAIIGGLRSHPQGWMQLTQWAPYRQATAAAWEQLGPAGVVAIVAGAVMAATNRRASWALGFGLLMIVLCVILFFSDHPKYVGYSRFSLYFAPVLVLAVASLSSPFAFPWRHTWWVQVCALVAISSAGWLSGPHTWASRENWGSKFADTAEYYYPYDRAVAAIPQKDSRKDTFCVSGSTYPYHVLFYVRQTGMQFRQFVGQNADGLSLGGSVTWASNRAARYLVFHQPLPVDGPPGMAPSGARFMKRFEIGRRALDVYDLAPTPDVDAAAADMKE
jgi:hypothetical protein